MKVRVTARQMVTYDQTLTMTKAELKEWQAALKKAKGGDEQELADLADMWLDKRDCDDGGDMEEVEFQVLKEADLPH